MKSWRIPLQKFRKATDGAGVVEFALAVPFFFILTCGIVEVSKLFYTRLSARDITLEATRFAATGQQLNDPLTGLPLARAASVRKLIKDRAHARRIIVDSVAINPADGGLPGQLVQVRVFYAYKYSLAPLRGIAASRPLMYSVGSTMKNEPLF
ncbi:MAG TPA: TadE/TadG family type IV pilus assembly protein [Longimicrobiales bacterium]|nr:TadE/TadG family type IV pilus assembly protein [Longimicrobiales bacterium]